MSKKHASNDREREHIIRPYKNLVKHGAKHEQMRKKGKKIVSKGNNERPHLEVGAFLPAAILIQFTLQHRNGNEGRQEESSVIGKASLFSKLY